MTIEQQIEQNIPPKKHKSRNDYNYIRNNEVEYEWKCKLDIMKIMYLGIDIE